MTYNVFSATLNSTHLQEGRRKVVGKPAHLARQLVARHRLQVGRLCVRPRRNGRRHVQYVNDCRVHGLLELKKSLLIIT